MRTVPAESAYRYLLRNQVPPGESRTHPLPSRPEVNTSQPFSRGVTSARQLRATLAAGDAIHREWNTVVAGIARSRSARAGRDAAFHASEQARERYRTGTITQLDLLQVQRDAFNAEVSRIQADADLINARLQLRLSAGRNLLAATSSH